MAVCSASVGTKAGAPEAISFMAWCLGGAPVGWMRQPATSCHLLQPVRNDRQGGSRYPCKPGRRRCCVPEHRLLVRTQALLLVAAEARITQLLHGRLLVGVG